MLQTSKMSNRTIVHMDLDSFFVSVERLLDSSLEGKPVIIGSTEGRGVVSSCSYEARKFGVHSAMPCKQAKQLCPQAIFVSSSMNTYSYYSKMVTQIIEEQSPLTEKASVDEHYIDISGIDKYIKNSMQWTQELRQKIIQETGLPISYGLSTNKTVSKIATGEGKPNGEMEVKPGFEKGFLAPLSIKKIPGIGNKTYMLLRNMGIEKVSDIQNIPIQNIEKNLGGHGLSIWKKANGIDNTPVRKQSKRKSISKETTFNKDTNDMQILNDTIVSLVEKLTFDLRKSNMLTGTATLKLRDANFKTDTFQTSFTHTASDHILLEKAIDLLKKYYSRNTLTRLIGIRFSNLISGQAQFDLFNETEQMMHLYQSLDKIRIRFGDKAIIRSIGIKTKNKR